MNKLLIAGVAVLAFVLILIVGNLGGVGNASAVLLDWSTSRVDDGKLSSTIPESVASGLGGLGNLLLACAGTLLLWLFRVLHAVASWIQSVIDSWSAKSSVSSNANPNDQSADDATWAKCESLLEDAIYRGDRNLTVILCERMHGKPYLIKSKATDDLKADVVPNA